MKILKLRTGEHVQVSDEDFDYLNQWNWSRLQGYKKFYAARSVTINGASKMILMHRVVAERAGLLILGFEVDHIDNDGLNAQRSNLQPVTHAQNQQKMVKTQQTSTGVRGVTYNKLENKDKVRIQVNGNRLCIGTFQNFEEAVEARLRAEERYYGA